MADQSSVSPHEHEARFILGGYLATADPNLYRERRRAAAEKLADEFLALAQTEGLQSGREPGAGHECFVDLPGSKRLKLFLLVDGDIQLRVLDQYAQSSPFAETVPLLFDTVANELVGHDFDRDVSVPPGDRIPRVHALIVLARFAVEIAAAGQIKN